MTWSFHIDQVFAIN
jgi:hypothetical protein